MLIKVLNILRYLKTLILNLFDITYFKRSENNSVVTTEVRAKTKSDSFNCGKKKDFNSKSLNYPI